MLQEERATRFTYDAGLDVVHLGTLHKESGATLRRKSESATLLLDKGGFLVGVDLGEEPLERFVVMCGPHEAVASQKGVKVEVARDMRGKIAEVVVRGAKESIRGHEKNPYV